MNRARRPRHLLAALLRTHSRPSATAQLPKNVRPPMQRHRTPTSVLEALSQTVGPNVPSPQLQNDPYLAPISEMNTRRFVLAQARGHQAAQYFIQRFPEDFAAFDYEAPAVHGLRPLRSAAALSEGEPSPAALDALIDLLAPEEAWAMYQRLAATVDGGGVTSATRLRLLDLLAATNGRNSETTRLDADPLMLVQQRHERLQPMAVPDNQWDHEGPAVQLFEALPPRELGAGYRALVRGMVRHHAYADALQLHREMRAAGHWADRASYTAALRCVHTVEYSVRKAEDGSNRRLREWPWRAGLDILEEMAYFGIAPDAETFNALIFSLSASVNRGHVRPPTAVKCLSTLLKEMEVMKISPNLGTLNNLLRLMGAAAQPCQLPEPIERLALDDDTSVKFRSCFFFVTRSLLLDPAQKRFATVSDTETLLLFDRARHALRKSLDVTFGVHRVFQSSPNIAGTIERKSAYYKNVLSILMRIAPIAAIDIYCNEVNKTLYMSSNFQTKMLACFAKNAPDRADRLFANVFSTLFLFRLDRNDSLDTALFLAVQCARTFPAIRPALLRSVANLWQRILKERVPLLLPDRHAFLLLSCLMPDDPSQAAADPPPDAAALDLGLAMFLALYEAEREPPFGALHKFLQLGAGLLAAGRGSDGAEVLRGALGLPDDALDVRPRPVNKRAADESEAVLRRLLEESPEAVAALREAGPEVLDALERHADGSAPCWEKKEPRRRAARPVTLEENEKEHRQQAVRNWSIPPLSLDDIRREPHGLRMKKKKKKAKKDDDDDDTSSSSSSSDEE